MPTLAELLAAPDNAMKRARQRVAGQEVDPVSPEEQAVHQTSLAAALGSVQQPSKEIAKDVFRITTGPVNLRGRVPVNQQESLGKVIWKK